MNKKILLLCFTLLISNSLFSEVYKKDAIVSYYAEDFHGKKTSNGEIYNMNALTCASKELPFNSRLKVTNLANGKSVEVRVNDRGPFVPDRVLDLSKAAAIKLGMIADGTAHVKIEIIEMGPNTKASVQTAQKAQKLMAQRFPNYTSATPKQSATSSAQTKIDPKLLYDIQLGAFSSRENANKLAQQLLKEGFTDVVFQKSDNIYRVVIRAVPGKDVPELQKKLSKNNHKDYTIKKRKV